MRFDIDRFREIIDTLTRNKTRSFLTGFGVFWGVFMLVALLGGGQGLKELLQSNFEGFATNSAIIFAQPTTKPYAGFRKERQWNMVYNDVERLKRQVPELETVSPMLSHWGGNATHGDKKTECTMKGVMPDYRNVEAPLLFYGRFINDMDIQNNRKVCVIGKRVYKELFPGGGDPCGQRICVDNIYYDVVGVDYSAGNMSINGRSETSVVVPFTMMQKAYALGDNVHLMCVTAKPGITMSSITQKMRSVIAKAHQIDPTDEKAVTVFNTEVMFGMLDNPFLGRKLPHPARRNRHTAGRGDRSEQHNDGNRARENNRDRYPQGHRRHAEEHPRPDNNRERDTNRGRWHERNTVRRDDTRNA